MRSRGSLQILRQLVGRVLADVSSVLVDVSSVLVGVSSAPADVSIVRANILKNARSAHQRVREEC